MPDAPGAPAAVPGTGSIAVSWEPPAGDGGSPIEGYKVQWRSGSQAWDEALQSVLRAQVRAHTLTGLDAGTAYAVRVVAFNTNGDGAPSAEATVTAGDHLTAAFPETPHSDRAHAGLDDRPAVVVAFSRPVKSFEAGTPSVETTAGTVLSVAAHSEAGFANAYRFILRPAGDGPIVFRLHPDQPCASGGICSTLGSRLSEVPAVRVLPGPGPAIEGAAISGATLVLTFDEALDARAIPDARAFSVSNIGTTESTAVTAVSIREHEVTLTLRVAATAGHGAFTVNYAPPTQESTPRLQDLAGNDAPGFRGQPVTNRTPVSSDAALSMLRVHDADLAVQALRPRFDHRTTSYAVHVLYSVKRVTILARAAHVNGSVAIVPADSNPGDLGHQTDLEVGANTITSTVTAEDGRTTKTYTVTVTRAAPPPGGICARTPAVRDHILFVLRHGPGYDDECWKVTATELAKIRSLELSNRSIGALKPEDFSELSGLTELELDHNALRTLPAGLFDGLTALTELDLDHNALRTLPAGLFDGLTALTELDLSNNHLDTLPFAAVDSLSALTDLSLAGNPGYENGLEVAPVAVALAPGESGEYRIRLTTRPRFRQATVTVTAESPGLTVEPATLTFTGRTWFRAQAVTVEVAGDAAVGRTVLSHAVKDYPGASVPGVTVTVTGTGTPLSTDATLGALALSGVTLRPAFSGATERYTARVAPAVRSVTVTAEPHDANASLTVNPAADADGETAGHQVALAAGDTAITITVTAEDGNTRKTYTVTVTRPEPEPEPELALTAGASPVPEGTAAAFTLRRTGPTLQALRVAVRVTESGAMLSGPPPDSVTFEPGEREKPLTVATAGDRVVEAASTVTVAITNGVTFAGDQPIALTVAHDGTRIGTATVTLVASDAPAPLTASVATAPATHSGSGPFTLRILFSEPVTSTPAAFKDHALEVTGGAVTGARQVDGRGDLWEITVTPDSTAAVVIALPAGRACDAPGAICTAAGQRLSNRLEQRVGGPVGVTPLAGAFPGALYASALHKGPTDRPQVVVAFTEAVAHFAAATPSVAVTGAALVGVWPHHVEPDLANAYIFILQPVGQGPLVFNLLPGHACASGGICTPGGTVLSVVPPARVVPGPVAPAAPVITSPRAVTVDEGATTVATLTATDADTAADRLTWSIPSGSAGGADRRQFTLSAAGVLAFTAAKDFEAPDDVGRDRTYEVTVRVTDGANPVEAALTVRLRDVADETPPGLRRAEVHGATLVLTWTEALDGTSVPAPAAFTVFAGPPETRLTPAGVVVRGATATLTLDRAVAAGETVAVSYAVPARNPLRDAGRNRVAALVREPVTNHTPFSTDATLGALTLSGVTLRPAFSGATERYTARVAHAVRSVTVTAEPHDGKAGVAYDPVLDADAGMPGHQVALAAGDTAITITVTAADGRTRKTYTVTVSFGQAAYTATEGGAAAPVTVTLSADPVRAVTVALTAVGAGGATAGDWSLAPTSVAFSSGETSKTVTVTAVDDAVDDDGESVRLGFAGLPEGVSPGSRPTATVSLVDNDDPAVAAPSEDICGRTPAVRDGIMSMLRYLHHYHDGCAAVPAAELAKVEHLELFGSGIGALQPGDFAGLSGLTKLNLRNNALGSLPAGVFADLTALTELKLSGNRLRTLSAAVFDGLGSLTELNLRDNALDPIPFAAFEALPALTELGLYGNPGYRRGLDVSPQAVTVARGGRGEYRIRLTSSPTLGPRRAEVSVTAESPGVTATPAAAKPAGPAVTGVSVAPPAAGGRYVEGETIAVTVRFGAVVTVDTAGGTPTIGLSVGGKPRLAAYARGSGTRALVFAYQAGAADARVAQARVLSGSLKLNGGTIRDGAGLDVDPAFHVAPVVTDVSVISDPGAAGVDGEGEMIAVTVRFSETVTVDTAKGTPSIGVTLGAAVRAAAYARGSGTPKLTFAYTVTAADRDPSPVHIVANSLSRNGGTIRNGVGLDAALAYDVAEPGAVAADAAEPGRPALSVADAKAQEGVDETIEFTVTLRPASPEPVTVAWATVAGTARAGEDYIAASDTLTFAPGTTAQTIVVTVLDDAKDEGEETFTLLLRGAEGAMLDDAEAVGTIANSDPLQKMWLARFGRTVASQVVDAVGERLRGAPDSHVTVGGRRLQLGSGSAGAEEPEPAAAWDGGFWDGGLEADPRLGRSRTLTLRDVLVGSSFRLTLGADDERSARPRWTAWGRVAATRFDGVDDSSGGPVVLDGEVVSGMLGVDGAWDRWLAGVVVSHSTGDGGFDLAGAGSGGDLEHSLTSVHPYLRYAVTERVDVWGVLGYGWGEVSLVEDRADATLETDTGLLMGAVGGRGVLVPAAATGGFQLAVRTDALLSRMTSVAVAGLESAAADVSRLRLGLDGTYAFAFDGGASLAPSFEVGLRHDGGAAETGVGLELGGALRYANPARGLTADLRVRSLLAHEDSGFGEWGAAGSFRYDPAPASALGPALGLALSRGGTASGVDALWQRPTMAGIAATDPSGPGPALEANGGYGFSAFEGWVVSTPSAGVLLSARGAAVRLGYGLGFGPSSTLTFEGLFQEGGRTLRLAYGYRLGPSGALTLEGIRREHAQATLAPNHGVLLRVTLGW